MSQKRYSKLEIHPRTKEWEVSGIAILTEEEAETLNECTKHTGVKFEVEKTKTAKK